MELSLSFVEWSVVVASSLIAIVGAIWTLMSYCRRPQFIIGVPPNYEEQKSKGIPRERLGHKSIVSQFSHKSDCFATRIRDKEELSERDLRRLFSDSLRCRLVYLTPDNRGILAVVVENFGARAAREYILSIQILSPHVHVTDITTESLVLGAFYANREDMIESTNLRFTDRKIIEAYDNYMELGEQYGDTIFLQGDLEGGMFELIILKIAVEPFVDKFVIAYSLDCSDWWLSRQAFFQGFVVRR